MSLLYCPYLFISSNFTTLIAQHSTQHTQDTTTHTHTHTHLPLTVILSVVRVRVTRGKTAKMSEQCRVRGISGEGSFRYRRASRSSAAEWRRTNRTKKELVPSEVSLILRKKRLICGIGNVLFSTFSQTSNAHDYVVTRGEPLEQVITLRGPFVVSIKMAMRHEPNMALGCCSR